MTHILHMRGSLDMNDVKFEDAKAFDINGSDNVDGIAVVVDGASGFQKDINEKGEIVKLPDIIDGNKTSASVWAEILADKLVKNGKKGELGLVDVLENSIFEATMEMRPLINKEFKTFQTPSSPVLMARVHNGKLEILGSGDCGILIEYTDGKVEAVTGSTILDEIRAKRSEKIRRENPGFDSMSPQEKAKIQFKYMKETRANLGDREQGYFVPHFDSNAKMKNFLGDLNCVSSDKNRSLNKIERGDIYEILAPVDRVKSFMLSTDGFLEKVLKHEFCSKEELIKNCKQKGYINRLGEVLRAVEQNSQSDFNAVAMKMINKSVKAAGSSDDATALFFEIPNEQAKEARLKSINSALVLRNKKLGRNG